MRAIQVPKPGSDFFACHPLPAPPAQLIGRRLSIQGWPSRAQCAYHRMITDQVRFRAVLVNR
jgi:hypothetical protein